MGNNRFGSRRKSKKPHHVAKRKKETPEVPSSSTNSGDSSAINIDNCEDDEINTPEDTNPLEGHFATSTPLKRQKQLAEIDGVLEGPSPPVKFRRVGEAKTYSQQCPIQQEPNNATSPVSILFYKNNYLKFIV